MLKSFSLLCIICSLTTVSFGQATWLRLVSHHYQFHIELQDSSGIVFMFQYWSRAHMAGLSISHTDTLVRSVPNSDTLYSGKKYRLQKEKETLYLVSIAHSSKAIKIEVDTSASPNPPNYTLNEGYWYNRFLGMYDSLRTTLPWSRPDLFTAFHYWSSFKNQHNNNYRDFQAFVDRRLLSIRDSIVTQESKPTLITRSIVDSAAFLSAHTLGEKFSQLLALPRNHAYVEAAASSMCQTNPELFFALIEQNPSLKNPLFQSLYFTKGINKTVRQHPSPSPIKKEFLRKRTRHRLAEGAGFTAYGILYMIPFALVGWGVVALVKNL